MASTSVDTRTTNDQGHTANLAASNHVFVARSAWQLPSQASTNTIQTTPTTWNAASSQPPYAPQFSATTSLILSRMKGGHKDFSLALSDASATVPRPDKDAYEDARTRLVRQMNTSLTMPAPEQGARSQQSLDEIMQKGTKRKRDSEKHAVDFFQSTIAFPKQLHPLRPKPQEPPSVPSPQPTTPKSSSGTCVKCGSSLSVPPNLLITCGRCNIVCHHACFSPPLPADEEEGKDPRTLCPQCTDSTVVQLSPHLQSDDLRRKQKIEMIRQTRLAALPDGVVPAKPELVGFGPGAASDRARADYFYNMTRTDVLNLLSFCDQVRPNLLVDIMVSVSKRHPDLPMFNSPDWDTSVNRHSGTSKAHHQKRAVASGRPPHGRSLLNSKAKQKIRNNIAKPPTAKKPHKRSQLAEEMVFETPPDDVEDAPPPTWPKSGEGLYVKLVPEVEDRLFLADENDEEAFSHFMVDKLGRQIIDPV